jgi:hypothetical protein
MPVGNYNANFIVSAVTYGFDIRTNGYQRATRANSTTRVIPWSATYAVVTQTAGVEAKTRTYRVLFYTELEFVTLEGLVGATGVLTTVREAR